MDRRSLPPRGAFVAAAILLGVAAAVATSQPPGPGHAHGPGHGHGPDDFLPPGGMSRWELGVQVEYTRQGGVITQVVPRSPAARVGFEPGDTIISVCGHRVGRVGGRTVDLQDVLHHCGDRQGRVAVFFRDGRTGRANHATVQLAPVGRQAGPEPRFRPGPGYGPGYGPGPGYDPDPGHGGPGHGGRGPTEEVYRQIDALYRQYLGREGEPNGLRGWGDLILSGVPLGEIKAGMLGSTEFFDTAANNPAVWVDQLYRRVLGRAATPQEVHHWVGELQARYAGDRVHLARAWLSAVGQY